MNGMQLIIGGIKVGKLGERCWAGVEYHHQA
ncbi:Uncharacterised protein [Vibrio cholerae]|nr:Uncharacterised protein [Vibrio cholerae]